VELQNISADLEAQGIALYAISYDPPDVLASFAARHGISYPLLSDAGSELIRELGILNAEAPESIEGIPHPGVFVLDENGIVAEKHFYESYRERDTGLGLLEHVLGIAAAHDGPQTQAASDVVQLRADFDAPTYVWGQRLWLTVRLTIADGYHIYGRPIPGGYMPLDIEIEPLERVTVGAPRWPTPEPFQVAGLDEHFQVFSGEIEVSLPLSFMSVDAGALDVRGTVTLQACTATECLAPDSLSFEMRLLEAPLVERPQPRD
jgi:hypothetical protein